MAIKAGLSDWPLFHQFTVEMNLSHQDLQLEGKHGV